MAEDTPTRDENMIAALKRERATYVSRGQDDRVAQVDEQLKHYGYEGQQDPATDPDGGPKGRTPQGDQRTADGGKDDQRTAPPAGAPKASPASGAAGAKPATSTSSGTRGGAKSKE